MLSTHYCKKGCCVIKIKEFSNTVHISKGYKKAGVFIYDPDEKRVLLVQSHGQLWGPPKGTVKTYECETNIDCAIREVKEETGLDVTTNDFSKATKIKNRAMYYYVEMKKCDVNIQEHENIEKNDVTGISWIKIDCLEDLVNDGKIILNKHCILTFKRFLKIFFTNPCFSTM